MWSEQKVTANDGNAQAWFGSWVAVSGSMALVGARNTTVNGRVSQGAVYVFRKRHGSWTQTQKLVADDGAAGDAFGSTIALVGNIAMIAAPTAKVGANTWQGATYVFALASGPQPQEPGWVQVQKLVAAQGRAFETFGTAVAFNSKFAFVGAGGAHQGAQYVPRVVYVFKRGPDPAGNDWSELQRIDSPTPADPTSSFGGSIAVSEAHVLIGARATLVDGNIGQGIVYLCTESHGLWNLTGKLTADDGAVRDNFGVSIALGGATAMIGAPGATIHGNVSQGAVYRFENIGGTWQQTQKLTANNGTAANLFGASVNVFKDSALVGAYAENAYRGAAYLFALQAGTWTEVEKLTASDAAATDVFGYYTALDQATVLIGAYGADIGANPRQGAVYFYTRPTTGPVLGPADNA